MVGFFQSPADFDGDAGGVSWKLWTADVEDRRKREKSIYERAEHKHIRMCRGMNSFEMSTSSF